MNRTPNCKADSKPTLHRDGTVSYWSVYNQSWERGRPGDRELAAMDSAERSQVVAHLDRHAEAS